MIWKTMYFHLLGQIWSIQITVIISLLVGGFSDQGYQRQPSNVSTFLYQKWFFLRSHSEIILLFSWLLFSRLNLLTFEKLKLVISPLFYGNLMMAPVLFFFMTVTNHFRPTLYFCQISPLLKWPNNFPKISVSPAYSKIPPLFSPQKPLLTASSSPVFLTEAMKYRSPRSKGLEDDCIINLSYPDPTV